MADNFYSRIGKRWFDATVSFAALVLLSPLFLIVAMAIKLTGRGPVFFRQLRVGRFEQPFRIFKFRTMVGTAIGRSTALTAEGDPRITPLGRWLRKTKVDELPQLLNVLWGDMSLVGPRPEVPQYTARYDKKQKRVLLVKPGITGPAATNYIDEEQLLAGQSDKESFYVNTILPAKLEYDLAYCEEVCFPGDLRLIWSTFAKVCQRIAGFGKPLVRAPENSPRSSKTLKR